MPERLAPRPVLRRAQRLQVSSDVRARIEACEEGATLDRWIARATTAASAEEVIAASR